MDQKRMVQFTNAMRLKLAGSLNDDYFNVKLAVYKSINRTHNKLQSLMTAHLVDLFFRLH